jgi:hypothetical protein
MTTAPSTSRRNPFPLRRNRPRHVADNWHASDGRQPASAPDVRQPLLVGPEWLIDDPDKAAGRGRLGDAY